MAMPPARTTQPLELSLPIALTAGGVVAVFGALLWNFFFARLAALVGMGGESEPSDLLQSVVWGAITFGFVALGVITALTLVERLSGDVHNAQSVRGAAIRFVVGGVVGAYLFYAAPGIKGSTREFVERLGYAHDVTEWLLAIVWSLFLIVLPLWFASTGTLRSTADALVLALSAAVVLVLAIVVVLIVLSGDSDFHTTVRGLVAGLALRVLSYAALLRLLWSSELKPPPNPPTRVVTLWSGDARRLGDYRAMVRASLQAEDDTIVIEDSDDIHFQERINDRIRDADLVLCLIGETVGEELMSEVDLALESPQAPQVYPFIADVERTPAVESRVVDFRNNVHARGGAYGQDFLSGTDLQRQVIEVLRSRDQSFTAPEDRWVRVPSRWRSPRRDWSRHRPFERALRLIEKRDVTYGVVFGWGHDTSDSSANADLATAAIDWLGGGGDRILVCQAVFDQQLPSAVIPDGTAAIVAPHSREYETSDDFADSVRHLLERVHRRLPELTVFAAEPQVQAATSSLSKAGFESSAQIVERASWWNSEDPQRQVRSRMWYLAARVIHAVLPGPSRWLASRMNSALTEKAMQVRLSVGEGGEIAST